MIRSTVFTTNRSQAVRLPKAVAFPEGVHQVEIIKLGSSRLITPVGKRWDDYFLNGPRVSEDFMSERAQRQLLLFRQGQLQLIGHQRRIEALDETHGIRLGMIGGNRGQPSRSRRRSPPRGRRSSS